MPFDTPTLTETSPTFASVLHALETASLDGIADIPDPTRRRLIRDVRQFCRWSGRNPDSLSTHPKTIQSLTKDWTGATFGVSDKRYANVLSSLRKALALASEIPFDRKPVEQLTGHWANLMSGLQRSWAKPVLSPFVRWCAAQGITPDVMTTQIAENYLSYRESRDVRHNRQKLIKQLRNAWARAQRDVTDWPRVPLEIGKSTQGYMLPWEVFPKSLRDEVESYRKSRGVQTGVGSSQDVSLRDVLMKANPELAESNTALSIEDPLGQRTLDEQTHTLRLAASTAVRADGCSPDELISIANITTPASAAATAEEALNRNGRDSSYAGNLIKNLRSIRSRWIGLSEEEKHLFKCLRTKAEEGVDLRAMRPQNREKLTQFDDPARLRRLITWPRRRMMELEQEREHSGRVTQNMALEAQACAMGLLLMSLPVRRSTLKFTSIEENFRWPTIGKGGTATLSYSSQETKTNRPAAVVLSEWKVELLRTYMSEYRPRLLAQGNRNNPYLFPGQKPGQPKSYSKIAKTMTQAIRKQVGVHVNMHFFRHLMASLLLRQSRNLDLARALLGHSDGSAVIKLYAEMQQRWSAEDLDRITTRMAEEHGRLQRSGNAR
ncbi:site-specific integrase [Fodinicurvata sediminis]|uniref:site-specific integrase n=1 Tax=Fodinicurvata sediminis TaxID=1121832 RepID=UPI0003B47885|nr:site-specific integrase [Fodinicurvata sediminis]